MEIFLTNLGITDLHVTYSNEKEESGLNTFDKLISCVEDFYGKVKY